MSEQIIYAQVLNMHQKETHIEENNGIIGDKGSININSNEYCQIKRIIFLTKKGFNITEIIDFLNI